MKFCGQSNHNSYYEKCDHEKHDCEFYKNKNTQNFFIKFKTNNKKNTNLLFIIIIRKKTLCQQIHCFCISKKHKHLMMIISAALKLNTKFTYFIIILKIIIHYSKEFQICHAFFNMKIEQNFINQFLIKKKNFFNV